MRILSLTSVSILVAVLSSVAAVAAFPGGEAEPRFERFTAEDGLTHDAVYSLALDETGFLWLATQGGLNRYDGYSFKTYLHDPLDPSSLAESAVSQILLDRDATLWLATWGGGLDRLDPSSSGFVHFHADSSDPQRLAGSRTQSLYEDRRGILWVGTFDAGLSRFDRASGTFQTFRHDDANPASLADDRVWAMVEDAANRLWVATGNGLSILDRQSGTFAVYRHDPQDPGSLSHDLVRTLYVDRTETLWVGTEDGLNRFDPARGGFVRYLADPADPSRLLSGVVNVVYEDSLGQLWIGTDGGGLNLFDRATGGVRRFLYVPGDPHTLADNDVRAILEDRSQVLWIATRGGGVSKLDLKPRRFRHLNHRAEDEGSLVCKEVRDFAEDHRYRLWVATEKGLDRWDEESGSFLHFRPHPGDPSSLPGTRIVRLYVDRAGVLWTASWRDGLSRYLSDEAGFKTLRHDPSDPESLPSDLVSLIHEDREGNFWIGTQKGLSLFDRRQEKVTAHYNAAPDDPEGLADTFFWAVVEDEMGDLWIGTDRGGLHRFDVGARRFERFLADPDDPRRLRHNRVYTLHQAAGRLWVGTAQGLDELRADGTFRRYGPGDGLPNVPVTNILSDEGGNLWITTDAGLLRFDPASGAVRTFHVKDGLQGLQFRAGASLARHDGELLFGGDNGFNAFHPAGVLDNPHVPPVVLVDFKVFGESRAVPTSREIELGPGDDHFSFELAALDFTRPSENRYRYVLEGFDDDWIDAGTERVATYTDLAPGDYVFRAQGSNNDGRWNEDGVTVRVRRHPPWWRTAGFLAFVALSAAASGVLLVWLRRRRASRREAELERRIEEGLIELKRSEKRYRQLFERNLAGVVRARFNGRLLDCNDAFARIFGYASQEECLREHRLTVGHKTEVHREFLARLRETGMVESFETSERTSDGSEVTLLWNANLAEESTGLGMVIEGTVVDLSQRREIEERMRQGQKLESLGILAGGIAHDFNNLLVGVLGNTELIRRKLPNRSPLHENLDEIEAAAQRATALSQKMLAYSGKGRFVTAHVELSRAVEEMAPLVDGSIAKRLTVRYELAEDGPAIKTDPNQLSQVIVNLVTNAAEAIGEASGEIVLRTGSTHCEPSDLAAAAFFDEGLAAGTYAFLEVKDSGSGMDRETLDKMFDPFFSTRFPGRGLGLPVVLGIVRGHEGAIVVESEPQKGTTIRVLFPVAEAPAEAERAAVQEADDGWKGSGQVLIVDDEAIVRKIGRQMMEILGFEVLTADDGREGVEIFRRHAGEIVLVLLDLTMPEMGGEEAFAEIRRIRADARVVIVTGFDEQETLRRFEGEDLSGFVQKPFRIQVLREKVRTALQPEGGS